MWKTAYSSKAVSCASDVHAPRKFVEAFGFRMAGEDQSSASCLPTRPGAGHLFQADRSPTPGWRQEAEGDKSGGMQTASAAIWKPIMRVFGKISPSWPPSDSCLSINSAHLLLSMGPLKGSLWGSLFVSIQGNQCWSHSKASHQSDLLVFG